MVVTVHVQTHKKPHHYPIYIANQLLTSANQWIKHIKEHCVIVTNSTVAAWYLKPFCHSLKAQKGDELKIDVIEIPDGEPYKNWSTAHDIYDQLIALKADRSTTLMALGGGVIGDITGFVAATYQRGVPYLQCPTTLLAQVDSSIGGKTAINHPLGKNMIGAFYQPQAVLIDPSTLSTLPQREFCAGLAEVIKYGLIQDQAFFRYLETHMEQILEKDPAALEYIIHKSCSIKAHIVEQDEYEQNMRAWLNFGHTFGHAIESATHYEQYLHGEAVAMGMVLAARLSVLQENFPLADEQRIKALLQRAQLPISLPPECSLDELWRLMQYDKKVRHGNIHFILLEKIGCPKIRAVEPKDFI